MNLFKRRNEPPIPSEEKAEDYNNYDDYDPEAGVDELKGRPARALSKHKREKLLREQKLIEEFQKNEYRPQLFKWAKCWSNVLLALSVVAITVYTISDWGNLSPAVFCTWFASVVAEVLGINAIIARYLFQTRPVPTKKP